MTAEITKEARLCAACGLCCNGVLFFGAALQAGDDVRGLTALGLRVKKRDGILQMLQPCPGHKDSACSVYAQRPVRCRIFECRQLMALSAGEITEEEAHGKIQQAAKLVGEVRQLFQQAGDHRENKAFVTRYAAVFTEPVDPSPELSSVRADLEAAMKALEAFLQSEFRVD